MHITIHLILILQVATSALTRGSQVDLSVIFFTSSLVLIKTIIEFKHHAKDKSRSSDPGAEAG